MHVQALRCTVMYMYVHQTSRLLHNADTMAHNENLGLVTTDFAKVFIVCLGVTPLYLNQVLSTFAEPKHTASTQWRGIMTHTRNRTK